MNIVAVIDTLKSRSVPGRPANKSLYQCCPHRFCTGAISASRKGTLIAKQLVLLPTLKQRKDWPTPQAFNEAIQNPSVCFADPDLKAGTTETNSLGLPKVASGTFASVYKVLSSKQTWAVRCFLTLREEQKDRYEHIGNFILVDDLDCTISFDYLDQGIKLGAEWYPVLKMPWVDGPTLDNYIHQNIGNRQRLEQLCKDFHTLSMQLEDAGIAHGDLQHGNIICSPTGLRLVDYDAFFVPSLAGRKNLEFGHPSYQHPLRDEALFDVTVDNFSSWLIYISIHTLSIDPDLFKYVAGGDDCLLFRRSDLAEPETSIVFANMLAHDSEDIRKHAKLLMRMLWTPPHLVPPLNASPEDLEKLSTVKPPQCTQESEHDSNSQMDIDLAVELLTRDSHVADGDSSSKATGKRKRSRNENLTTKAKRLATEIVDLSLRRAAKPLWLCVTRIEAEKVFKAGNFEQAYVIYSKLHQTTEQRSDETDIVLLLRLAHCCLKLDNQNQMENFCKAAANLVKTRDSEFNQLLAAVLFAIARKQHDREWHIIDSMSKLLEKVFDVITYPMQFNHLTNVVAIMGEIVPNFRDARLEESLTSFTRMLICHIASVNYQYEQKREEKYVDYLVQLRHIVDALIKRLEEDENLVALATVISQISIEPLVTRMHRNKLRELLSLHDSILGNEIVFLGQKIGFLHLVTRLADVACANYECDEESVIWLWELWLNFEPFNTDTKIRWLGRYNQTIISSCLNKKNRMEIIHQVHTKVIETWDLYTAEQVIKSANDLGNAGKPLKSQIVSFVIDVFDANSTKFRRTQLVFARSLVRIYGSEQDVLRLESVSNKYL